MTDAAMPETVLFIDDDRTFAQAAAASLRERGFAATGVHPSEVGPPHVAAAELVVLDEYLEDWDRPAGPATTAPEDGLAVGVVLRSQKSSLSVVILTGDITRLADGVPVLFGEHHIAALRDVEWVFSKTDPRSIERIATLSAAISTLPMSLTSEDLVAWLRVPSEPWGEEAIEHITRCRPPLAPRQTTTGPRQLMRWLLQRALPYPTFLLTDRRAALVMGVDVSTLDGVATDATTASCVYDGPLATFLERRWWRAGVEHLAEVMDVALSSGLVVPLGDELEELDPVPLAECVRIYPDGWPAFADQAWALRDDIFPGSLHEAMLGVADSLGTPE